MTTAIKRRRGTTTQHSTFTGLEGEITVDSTKDTVVVHDGSTAGGFALLREDLSNNTNVITATNTKTLTNKTVDLASNVLTGTTAQFNAALSDNDFATLAGTETLSNKTFSTNPTISSGTANGVAYLNGSKVLTTGSALVFDGSNLGLGGTPSAWGGSYKAIQLPGGAIDSFQSNAITMICNAYDAAAGAWTYKNNGYSSRYDQASDGAHRWLTAPSGTAGNAISFTQAMTLDASGNLGIGTSSFSYPLTVNRATTGAVAQFWNSSSYGQIFIDSGGTNQNSYLTLNPTGNGSAVIQVNNADKLTIDSSGNLGLGVTPSAWNSAWRAYEIQKSGNSFVSATVNNVGISSNAYLDSVGWKYGANGYANFMAVGNGGGSYAWYTAPSGTAGNAISWTQAMTLDASGNLGIGTSSPAVKLQVSSSSLAAIKANITSSAGNVARFQLTGGSADYAWYVTDNANYTALYDYNAGSERMRIDSSGNVGIGSSAPTSKLQVVGLPVYANNAAAIAGGLTAGAFYRTGADPDPVCVVH